MNSEPGYGNGLHFIPIQANQNDSYENRTKEKQQENKCKLKDHLLVQIK